MPFHKFLIIIITAIQSNDVSIVRVHFFGHPCCLKKKLIKFIAFTAKIEISANAAMSLFYNICTHTYPCIVNYNINSLWIIFPIKFVFKILLSIHSFYVNNCN